MFYGYTVSATLTRQLPEAELDALIKDVYSFKTRCRQSGKLFGKPNYIINVFDETKFDEVTDKFEGALTIYLETASIDDNLITDLVTILSKYELALMGLTRKLKV